MEGYLEKKKVAAGLQSFKTRYCKINSEQGILEYYAHHLDKKPKGILKLTELKGISAKADQLNRFSIEGNSWGYIVQCFSEAERDAWIEHLKVWVRVGNLSEKISIPNVLVRGILACIEFCGFYAQDVEGLLRVPGNSEKVKDIYRGICVYGEKYLTEPRKNLPGYKKEIEVSSKKVKSPTSNDSTASSNLNENLNENDVPVNDVFDVGSCLKLALKRLPETILTNSLFDQFLGALNYRSLVEKLPQENARILRAIMELTLLMWQAEQVTKMDPGKVAVCLSPLLLKRTANEGFCDFSFMFFEMAEHIEEVFGDVKAEKFFPGDFWNYLSRFDSSMGFQSENTNIDTAESKSNDLYSDDLLQEKESTPFESNFEEPNELQEFLSQEKYNEEYQNNDPQENYLHGQEEDNNLDNTNYEYDQQQDAAEY